MAWENYLLDVPFDSASATPNAISLGAFITSTGYQQNIQWVGGTSFGAVLPYGVEQTLADIENDGGHLIIYAYQPQANDYVRIRFSVNGTMYTAFSGWATDVKICFGINEENHEAQFATCQYYQHNETYIIASALGTNVSSYTGVRQTLYNIYKNAPLVQYVWQSVPSISGKNGILSLVTIDSESINDGEPVSGAAVSVFDQAPSNDNNIKNLADTYGSGEESSAVDVTVKYKVTLPPGGIFDVLKLVAKKDSMPNDVSDGDKIVDISPSKTKKTVTGLDENSLYYFKIFAEDTSNNTSESDEKHIMTSGDEGWSFEYTGEIQTFVAPKTGIYQLETWGAQGGNATDGTNSARGGYGAYAYGEVLLTQGETLYINVGGQNGYGGGGNYTPPNNS